MQLGKGQETSCLVCLGGKSDWAQRGQRQRQSCLPSRSEGGNPPCYPQALHLEMHWQISWSLRSRRGAMPEDEVDSKSSFHGGKSMKPSRSRIPALVHRGAQPTGKGRKEMVFLQETGDKEEHTSPHSYSTQQRRWNSGQWGKGGISVMRRKPQSCLSLKLTHLEKPTRALKGTALGQGAFSKLARYKPSKQKAAGFNLLPRERLKPSLGDAPVTEYMTQVIQSL